MNSMSQFNDRDDDVVGQALMLARDIAPDIGRIVFTHYADRDTLDVFRPGTTTDLEAVVEVNKAVAAELTALGVEIFVQRADRAAFRRWMHGRDDTPENRRRWIDRAKLLRGADAHRLLGLEAPGAVPQPNYGSAPGPIADQLVAAFDDGEDSVFDELAQGLLGAGRTEILDLAIRKIGGRDGEEAAQALNGELLTTAAEGRFGPSGWAELVALPVALPVHDLPDADSIGENLSSSGVLERTVEVRFLPGWRSPDALEELSAGAMRGVLLDLVAGVEPRDLPPGDTDDLTRRGFGVMLGLQIDWDIPIWDEIVAEGLPDALTDDEEDRSGQADQTALFDRWRATMFDAHQGCVPLALVPPSEVGAEIAAFLEEAGEHTRGIDDIREFVAMIRREAGSEEIVCHPEIIGDGLELSFYSESGRFLDSLTLPADRMPARADEMARLVGSFVRVVKDKPGR
jgi:hypothetical protein